MSFTAANIIVGGAKVEVEQNVLTVSGGKSKNVTDSQGGKYIRRELKRSSFRRSFTLGDNIEKDTVSATFENGILLITLNKVTTYKSTSACY